MKERRTEPRLLCSDLIQVRLEGCDAAEVTANLEDISASGACLQFEVPVAAGAGICLILGRHEFRGHVRYCVRNEIGHFAGIEFDAGQKWSRRLYEPKHLLDPRRMLAGRAKSRSNA